jgi:flagellar motor protein MotB
MDDGMTRKTKPYSKCFPLACCALLMLTQVGCQPQTRTGGGLFGIGNRTNYDNSAFSRSSFNNPFGTSANRTGSGIQNDAFTPSSPFGQFSQSSGGTFGRGTFAGSGSSENTPYDPSGLGQLGQPGIAREYGRIQQQLGAFDADNQLLNTEVATLKQKLELSNQYNQTLKQQLADTSDRITQTGNQQRIDQQQFASLQQQIQSLQQRIAQQDRTIADAERQLAQRREDWQGNTFQNSGFESNAGTFRNTSFGNNGGSATLRANNGLMQKLNSINIPGGDARMDGDIIRIEFPTDRLFTSGSYRVQSSQLPLLQNIASTIRQSFPRQIVGVEAHWDGTPLNPAGTTDHQLTATQSLAVIDELTRLGLPRQQLFMMALGSNRPRHPQQMVGGVSPNRRIELVIYPESYDQ